MTVALLCLVWGTVGAYFLTLAVFRKRARTLPLVYAVAAPGGWIVCAGVLRHWFSPLQLTGLVVFGFCLGLFVLAAILFYESQRDRSGKR